MTFIKCKNDNLSFQSDKTLRLMRLNGRFWIILTGFALIVSVLAIRVVMLQVREQQFLRSQGDARTIRVASIPAYRGMITDRNGDPIAISTPVQTIWLNPKEFNPEHPELLMLTSYLDLSLDQLLDKYTKNQNREFVYLQRHLSPVVAESIRKMEIPGIHVKSEYRRYYPGGEVTAHLTGFTDLDDKGQEGLELSLEQWLKGKPGSKRVVRDRKGREVQVLEGLAEMQSGQDVTLSIDQRLQYLAYRALKSAVSEHHAASGSAVVVDVETGEVLAMCNQPSFNPNTRVKLQVSNGCYRNRAVTDVFEPGSVMKTLSVVSALQTGHVSPTTLVDTSPGWMMVGGRSVKEDKNKNFGLIDVTTVLKKSSNVGVTKLTLAHSPDQLYDTYQRLGFGSLTGIEFPGESGGVLNKPPKKGQFVLATMAFGYGLSVTPLQLAQAYAILGAGGVKRPLTLLKHTRYSAGEQVIDPLVAKQTVEMLAEVVENGGGTKAKVTGYRTAGKTGTARKLGPEGGYQNGAHVAVFAGLAPANHPKFAIVVMIDDPQGGVYYGGQVAAPVFSKIAAGALRLFNISPDKFDKDTLHVAKHVTKARKVDQSQ